LVGKVMSTLFLAAEGSILKFYQEGHNSKQCPLERNAWGPAKISHLNQTLRTIFERCCNGAYCLSTHYHPHHWKHPPTELWGVKASSISPDLASSITCSMLWVGAILQMNKNTFPEGIQKPVDCWTTCVAKVGQYIEKLYKVHQKEWMDFNRPLWHDGGRRSVGANQWVDGRMQFQLVTWSGWVHSVRSS
jgi:hypothetical protein